jgi:mRNA-degrading endonuclease toxin of MazEF toxin-antitoxin module
LRDIARRLTRRAPGRDDGVRIAYTPDHDGDADPGEVVWTWVPYEDDPRQGKDRPVVVIGSTADGRLAVVPLTSRDHEGRRGAGSWVPVGTGRWDGQGRPSYADADRVLRVSSRSIRREGATLDRDRFDAVVTAVRRRHADVS